jgi:GyrI-like small molecule binding domain
MTDSPRLEDRPCVLYAAIPGSGSGERELRAFADASFPALFGWLGKLGAAPAAAPFFRFFRFVPDGDFQVEVGVPITTSIDDCTVRLAELPAGRYAVYLHQGAYSAGDDKWAGRDLVAARRRRRNARGPRPSFRPRHPADHRPDRHQCESGLESGRRPIVTVPETVEASADDVAPALEAA